MGGTRPRSGVPGAISQAGAHAASGWDEIGISPRRPGERPNIYVRKVLSIGLVCAVPGRIGAKSKKPAAASPSPELISPISAPVDHFARSLFPSSSRLRTAHPRHHLVLG